MVQRELSCVWMLCGAACGQGLRTQRSMRMHFLLSAPSLVTISTLTTVLCFLRQIGTKFRVALRRISPAHHAKLRTYEQGRLRHDRW